MWYLRRGDYFWKKREHSANNVCKELKVGIWEYARCTALWICLLISVENVLHLEKHRVLSMTDQNSLLWSTNMHYFLTHLRLTDAFHQYVLTLTFYIITSANTGLKAKQSPYRPRQTLSVPGDWGSQISWQSAHEGSQVVSRTHWPPLPTRKYSSYPFLLEVESTPRAIVRPEGLCKLKIPITQSWIEPSTSKFLAQYSSERRIPQKFHCYTNKICPPLLPLKMVSDTLSF